MALTRHWPGWPLLKQLVYPVRRLARARLRGPVDARLWGHRLRFEARGNISEGRLLFMPSQWDRREREALARHARPGAVFIDVGANFGGYTWWILSLLGAESRVVALEPDPELHARLRFNLDTNGWGNVTLLPYAAGEQDGAATLYVDDENRGENTLLQEEAGALKRGVEVPVRTLAAVLEEAGVNRVDMLKIDIEGLEPPVLKAFFDDADRALWPRLLLCERKEREEHEALEGYLEEKGYLLRERTRLNMILEMADA